MVPFPSFLLASSLIILHITGLLASSPILNLQIYNSTNCTGSPVTADTTWQAFGNLTNTQVQLGSSLDANAPCVNTNLQSGIASAEYSCGITTSGQSVLRAYEWKTSTNCSGVFDVGYALTELSSPSTCYTGNLLGGSVAYSSISATLTCSSNGGDSYNGTPSILGIMMALLCVLISV